jgi:hypothetical protein
LVLVVGLRLAIGAGAIVTASATFGVVASALYLVGGVVVAYALLLGAQVASMRLEAVPNELRLRSLFGTRRYRLRKGEVRRLWVRFSRRPLEARVGGLGVRFGEGQLGGERLVDVIALDEASTLLMVPVAGGRLAVAPDSEGRLMEVLERATRKEAGPSGPASSANHRVGATS